MAYQSDITKSISAEIDLFNKTLVETLKTDNTLLQSVIDYFLAYKGKQIRPMLVLLSAKLFGEINATTIKAAVAVELLHSASLIHDDVVDESNLRRGRRSINGEWDNRIAVLVGDYFVSCALKSAIESQNSRVVDIIANLGKELAKGELAQIETADNGIVSEERYMLVIKQKTASLFASCMMMGAISQGASDAEIDNLASFGEKLGLCFQIKDDIFDYFDDDTVGKPTGSDLEEGKVSLPLIYTINRADDTAREHLMALLSDHAISKESIAELVAYAKSCGGIDYAVSVMEQLKNEGADLLANYKNSDVVSALCKILSFITVRNF